ncbi:MAG TPA: metallophosphoesterase, partial [Mucilaginibacter sp.]|nr:metallophosphoesterase [Mucilaginibacter sp.]
MIKKIPLLFVLLLGRFAGQAQDSVRYRVILIGDAGEMDMQQSAVLKHAANNIIQNKTTVMYLGDNIYPHGMGLPGSPEEEVTKKILQSQYLPMRAKGAPVYFVPGNHDWDKMGPQGLAKIKRQWQYLNEQQDSLLKMVPANGCGDPVEINLNNNLTVIAFDSEWWLFPFNK